MHSQGKFLQRLQVLKGERQVLERKETQERGECLCADESAPARRVQVYGIDKPVVRGELHGRRKLCIAAPD